jgi:hypothetical protein
MYFLKNLFDFPGNRGERCQGFGTMLFEDKDRKIPSSGVGER